MLVHLNSFFNHQRRRASKRTRTRQRLPRSSSNRVVVKAFCFLIVDSSFFCENMYTRSRGSFVHLHFCSRVVPSSFSVFPLEPSFFRKPRERSQKFTVATTSNALSLPLFFLLFLLLLSTTTSQLTSSSHTDLQACLVPLKKQTRRWITWRITFNQLSFQPTSLSNRG